MTRSLEEIYLLVFHERRTHFKSMNKKKNRNTISESSYFLIFVEFFFVCVIHWLIESLSFVYLIDNTQHSPQYALQNLLLLFCYCLEPDLIMCENQKYLQNIKFSMANATLAGAYNGRPNFQPSATKL